MKSFCEFAQELISTGKEFSIIRGAHSLPIMHPANQSSKVSQDKLQDFFVHESSYVDPGARVGRGTRIWHFCHVVSGAVIGESCVLGQNVCVLGTARVGNRVKIQNNVSVYDAVILEDDVFCGPSCVFTNVVNPRAFIERKKEYRPTIVRRGATLGANCTVVCGHEIGEYAFIAAGAVVTQDVLPYALMVGVPGRRVGWVCRCAIHLTLNGNHAQCQECGLLYAYNPENDHLTLKDFPS